MGSTNKGEGTELSYLALANQLLDEKDKEIVSLKEKIENLEYQVFLHKGTINHILDGIIERHGEEKYFDTQAGYVIKKSELVACKQQFNQVI